MPQNYGALERVLRMGEGRRLKRLAQQAAYITSLEPDFERLSDEPSSPPRRSSSRSGSRTARTLDELVFEAYAAVREAAKRAVGLRPFDVQLMGAIVLHEGDIAEMKTGEGKTLVATMPLYLNALTGENVHLVTVNDYLAKRDAEWMGPVYEALGMRAAYIRNMMPFDERKAAYEADITYGTNSEFGFDYLRDNMATSLEGTVQRGHSYAIVDEVDSILIDEARTPLIISGEPETAARTYYDFARVAKTLEGVPAKFVPKGMPKDGGRRRLRVRREVQDGLTARVGDREGRARARDREPLRPAERAARQPPHPGAEGRVALPAGRRLRRPGRRGEDRRRVHRPDHGRPALVGRPPPGGRGQGGRGHQGGARHPRDDHAPELLPPLREARRHDRYGQDRGEGVPGDLRPLGGRDPDERARRPRRPRRLHLQDEGSEVQRRHRGHQASATRRASPSSSARSPSRSPSTSRSCSTRQGIPHNVLNAKQHEREAEIIKDAGERGAVTIATNMAGRGVDIKLGEGVVELGGLYVLGTERHEARRIDNQLRGRSGRQGDDGESRFYLSAQDDLVRLFAGDRIYKIMERFNLPDDEPMERKILSNQIENAQKKVEEQNFVSRKNVLKYDDVMNVQRMVIYEQRRRVLEGDDLSGDIARVARPARRAHRLPSTESEYPEVGPRRASSWRWRPSTTHGARSASSTSARRPRT